MGIMPRPLRENSSLDDLGSTLNPKILHLLNLVKEIAQCGVVSLIQLCRKLLN